MGVVAERLIERVLAVSPRLVAAIAGLPFGLLALAVIAILRDVGRHCGADSKLAVAATVELGLSGSTVVAEVGNSFGDVPVAALMLAALLALLRGAARAGGTAMRCWSVQRPNSSSCKSSSALTWRWRCWLRGRLATRAAWPAVAGAGLAGYQLRAVGMEDLDRPLCDRRRGDGRPAGAGGIAVMAARTARSASAPCTG